MLDVCLEYHWYAHLDEDTRALSLLAGGQAHQRPLESVWEKTVLAKGPT